MYLKKNLSVFLAIMIVLTLVLTACGTSQSGKTESQNSTIQSTQATTQAEEPYTGQLPLSPEKVTLTFATHQGWNTAMSPPSNDLPIYQEYERLTNVHIEWETVPAANYTETMTTRLAAGNALPDMLNLQIDGFNIQKLAEDGIIIAQNDLFDKYAYWTKEFIKELPSYKALITYPDGNIYGIEGSAIADHLPFGLMVNKYALERAGVNMPTTADELYNVLKAFKAKDINGNGKPDEVPLATINAGDYCPQQNLYVLGNAFGLELTWNSAFTVKNGQLVCQYQLPEYRDFLAYLNKLYKEGLLNQDVFTCNYDKLVSYISKGQCGAVLYWGTYSGDPFTGLSPDNQGDPTGNKAGAYYIAPPLKAPDGRQYFTKRITPGGDPMGITTACAEDKRPVAMKWIDFIFTSPKSLEMYNNGVEGLSYKKNADGTIEKIVPEGKKPEEWTAWITEMGAFQQPRAVRQVYQSWLSWMAPWQVEMDASLQKYFVEPSIVEMKWTPEENKKMTEVNTDLNTYINEMFVKFVTGKEPISKFDSFVQELDKRGINDVKTLCEQRYVRQKAALGN